MPEPESRAGGRGGEEQLAFRPHLGSLRLGQPPLRGTLRGQVRSGRLPLPPRGAKSQTNATNADERNEHRTADEPAALAEKDPPATRKPCPAADEPPSRSGAFSSKEQRQHQVGARCSEAGRLLNQGLLQRRQRAVQGQSRLRRKGRNRRRRQITQQRRMLHLQRQRIAAVAVVIGEPKALRAVAR